MCFSEEPPDLQCLIKGNIDRHYGQKTYHFPGCGGYPQVMVEKDLGEDWFCSEAQAQAAVFENLLIAMVKCTKPIFPTSGVENTDLSVKN